MESIEQILGLTCPPKSLPTQSRFFANSEEQDDEAKQV